MKIVKPVPSCESCVNWLRFGTERIINIRVCALWMEGVNSQDIRSMFPDDIIKQKCKHYAWDGSTPHPCSPCKDREHCQPELNRKCKTARSKK